MNQDVMNRFWSKIYRDPSGCWEWTGSKTHDGYGKFWPTERGVLAHRFAYEALVGSIPAEKVMDHLCRNRACANPDHVEPVTNLQNILRGDTAAARNTAKQKCPAGHLYDAVSTYVDKRGKRHCRICNRAAARAYKARRIAEGTWR